MLKRDIADQLYSKAIKRIKEERPQVNLTTRQMDAIWYGIYGELNSNGLEAAKRYVETAPLSI